MRLTPLLGMALALGLTVTDVAAQAATTNSPFAPVILVNGLGVTGYEIEQRMRFMQLLRQPGDLRKAAEKSLIEDRLRVWAAKQAGIVLDKDAVAKGMTEFAGRANLSSEQFVAELAKNGVDEPTFRDFVTAGLVWRELVKQRFGPRVRISDSDIDRAMLMESERGGGTRVLISEIILPAPPGQEAEAHAEAEKISQLRSEAAFAEAARQMSAASTRDNGGRLDWMPLDNLPPALRPVLLGLAPGQASAPIELNGAVAIFMMRSIDEHGPAGTRAQTLGYATLALGPAGSEQAAQLAQKAAAAKRCDDLYTVVKGLPVSLVSRPDPAPQGALPKDIALALAGLDIGETTVLTRGAGQELVMLCSREAAVDDAKGETAPNRDAVRARLQNERMGSYSDSYLADLTANAVIVRP